MGNRPKMSLKYAIFKICPKLARKWYSCETKVYSTIFGDSWRQKVVSVFGFWYPKSHFLHPKAAIFGDNPFTNFGDERNGKFGGDLVTISAQTVLKIFGTHLMTNLSQNKVIYSKRDTILMTQKIIQWKALPEIKSKCINLFQLYCKATLPEKFEWLEGQICQLLGEKSFS